MPSIRTLILALALALLAVASAVSVAATKPKRDPPKQLRIGVKHRPKECTQKTKNGDTVYMHYRGTLFSDGSEFDSSYKRGTEFDFTLGAGHVIKGWDQGLLGMCPGEKRKLVIPPELGYGERGAGASIPPGATLVFEVELVRIGGGRSDL
ncbi:hypothetical protein BCR44DRAFT_35563 [Catenaria anguillulae PL171]|uniref:peptidylprolyl isomerase n=1 Tax=Catenaria anguillulae PL171 TaxID=765915 RepID=A0A1Y2HLC2_9FUNG|nr:hypothetical protein BCR44DRAFT_35563 [Catenaria anguillulae PL171]